MNQIIDSILNVKFDDVLALLDQVINNPLSNIQASLLFLIGVVVLTLVAIALVVLFVGFGEDDEDEEEYGDEYEREPVEEVEKPRKEKVILPPAPPLTPEERRWYRAMAAVATIAAIVVVWLLTGLTTASDTMCLSCHSQSMPHSERTVKESTLDPHKTVACVKCHEPGGTFAAYTYNVPGRAGHFVAAMALPDRAKGFGTPIRSSACLSCHRKVAETVTESVDRGVKTSHKEPLDAGATCMDCHRLESLTGIVGPQTIGMSACLRCHDNEQASADCKFCHTKDVGYATSADRKPTQKRLVTNPQCSTCHEMKKCNACHGVDMPHSNQFLQTGHPYQATMDNWYNEGRTCKKCHTDTRNPCGKCHRSQFPGHPAPAWRYIHGVNPQSGYNGGCDGCHGYLARVQGRNFCAVCHSQYPEFPNR